MRRIVLLTLFALLAANAGAQRRGGFARAAGRAGFRSYRGAYAGYGGGYGYGGYGYASLPPDDSSAYLYAPTPAFYLPPPQPAPSLEPPPAPAHPQVIELKPPALPAADAGETFAIVLKNGATLDATTVVAMNDSLHYVDPDERHMQIAMSEVDRAATRRLNRQRNLTLYLPSPTP